MRKIKGFLTILLAGGLAYLLMGCDRKLIFETKPDQPGEIKKFDEPLGGGNGDSYTGIRGFQWRNAGSYILEEQPRNQDYYRLTRGYNCQNQPSHFGLIQFDTNSMVTHQNNSCSPAAPVNGGQIHSLPYHSNVIGYQEGIYIEYSEAPNLLSIASIPQAWCSTNLSSSTGISVLLTESFGNLSAVVRRGQILNNLQGNVSEIIADNVMQNRQSTGLSFQRTEGDFFLSIEQKTLGAFTSPARLSIYVDGQMLNTNLTCRSVHQPERGRTLSSYHTMYYHYNNQLWAWGANHTGAGTTIGVSGTGHPNANVPTPLPVRDANGVITDVVDAAPGSNHSCLIRSGGNVYCWGQNNNGELGLGRNSFVEPLAQPTLGVGGVGQLNNIVKLRLFVGASAFAIDRDSRLIFWGNSASGANRGGLVNPRVVNVPTFSELANFPVEDVVAGRLFTCVIVKDSGGQVSCWGDSSFLGVPGLTGVLPPNANRRVLTPSGTPLSGAKHLHSGHNTVCAELIDKKVVCWGDNIRGKTGTGINQATLATPNYVIDPMTGQPMENIIYLSVGPRHACLLQQTGSGNHKYCFGNNQQGQIGDPNLNRGNGALPYSLGIDQSNSIAATQNASCVAKGVFQVECWGSNVQSEMGTGNPSTGIFLTPQTVSF